MVGLKEVSATHNIKILECWLIAASVDYSVSGVDLSVAVSVGRCELVASLPTGLYTKLAAWIST